MWETYISQMLSLRTLPVLLLPILAVACASSTSEEDNGASTTSNLDTSGCSGVDLAQTHGAVQVSAQRPPTSSCWNVDESGLSIGYSWSQTTATPEKSGLSFWVGLNGASKTVTAEPASCERSSGGLSYGADTSGAQSYVCTAWARVDFQHNADFKSAAYGSNGRRNEWKVQVAVALPDGSWDSLNGANYQFAF